MSAAAVARRTWLLAAATALWAAAATASLAWLTVYSQSSAAPWKPADAMTAGIPLADDRYTLVMVVHPRCPCTRASLWELERLMARCGDELSCRLLFYQPAGDKAGAPDKWNVTDLGRLAQRIPRTTLDVDVDGAIAARLGASTSGSVVLYDQSGEPRFWGGITAARGHAGDNAGSDSIAGFVLNGSSATSTTPVYGCSILTPSESCCTVVQSGGASP